MTPLVLLSPLSVSTEMPIPYMLFVKPNLEPRPLEAIVALISAEEAEIQHFCSSARVGLYLRRLFLWCFVDTRQLRSFQCGCPHHHGLTLMVNVLQL